MSIRRNCPCTPASRCFLALQIPIQACLGAKPIASAHISPVMKDVLAKCYGGDVSRKKKLLQKQAKGKKRMRLMGKVHIPQEAFMAVIQTNSDPNS
jgi:translation elongation factor EF-4